MDISSLAAFLFVLLLANLCGGDRNGNPAAYRLERKEQPEPFHFAPGETAHPEETLEKVRTYAVEELCNPEKGVLAGVFVVGSYDRVDLRQYREGDFKRSYDANSELAFDRAEVIANEIRESCQGLPVLPLANGPQTRLQDQHTGEDLASPSDRSVALWTFSIIATAQEKKPEEPTN